MGYLGNFIVYLLAMLGLMMLAVFIFKNCTTKINNTNGKDIKVLDSISIGARKNLLVVSVGKEKFLIASDADRTALISKLEDENVTIQSTLPKVADIHNDYEIKKYQDRDLARLKRKNIIDESIITIGDQNKSYNSVMRNLAERMKG